MDIDVGKTILGLELLEARIDGALEGVVGEALHVFQAAGMRLAPVGVPGNTTNAPGDLARSIYVDGPVGGGGYYEGKVGPTVIYGRQRELGGDIYKPDGFMVFQKFGDTVFTHHVHQIGAHYMLRAYEEELPTVEFLAEARIDAALSGYR